MKRDLTLNQAHAEAVKRWGKNGAVKKYPPISDARYRERVAEICKEQEKREERSEASRQGRSRCEFVSHQGNRCSGSVGHSSPSHTPFMALRERLLRDLLELKSRRHAWCMVGKVELIFFAVKAEGPTFRAAFEEADRIAAKEKAEMDALRAKREKQIASLKKARQAKAAKAAATREPGRPTSTAEGHTT